jgi:protein associated with RNAse G/E
MWATKIARVCTEQAVRIIIHDLDVKICHKEMEKDQKEKAQKQEEKKEIVNKIKFQKKQGC